MIVEIASRIVSHSVGNAQPTPDPSGRGLAYGFQIWRAFDLGFHQQRETAKSENRKPDPQVLNTRALFEGASNQSRSPRITSAPAID